MLDLHARVHLDEEELVVLVRELEGAGAAIADLAHASAQRSPMRVSARAVCRRRRLLDDLLVAALHRAVALDRYTAFLCSSASTWISMCRGSEEFLHVDAGLPNAACASRARQVTADEQRGLGVHDAHCPRPPPPRRLDDHG
jgi:hypothetical protein